MSLRMFSIIGEALNFGARRIELVARVAWLPVLLLLILEMSTTFATLSVIAGKAVTFAEVTSMIQAKQYAAQYAERGWSSAPQKMALIAGVNFLFNIILVSSFLAPLIRYAGLGERPAGGFMRLPFGADQLRFMLTSLASLFFIALIATAPIAAAGYFVMQYIVEAMSQTMASFPDPESLHTIEIVSAGKSIIDSGTAWILDLALPLAAAAPFALLVWVLGVLHFHPSNRPHTGGEGNFFLRIIAVLLAGGALAAGMFYLLRVSAVQSLTKAGQGAEAASLTGTPINAILIFAALIIIVGAYVNIRLFAWPGVAVCTRSLAPAPTLQVSRGWNLFRLPLILAVLSGVLFLVLMLINMIALPAILSTINLLFQATETSTRLINSGAKGEWVLPLFVWIWNFVKIAVNFIWAFFSYGVIAGLYGRLYRESAETV